MVLIPISGHAFLLAAPSASARPILHASSLQTNKNNAQVAEESNPRRSLQQNNKLSLILTSEIERVWRSLSNNFQTDNRACLIVCIKSDDITSRFGFESLAYDKFNLI